jgi:hypothetical protein
VCSRQLCNCADCVITGFHEASSGAAVRVHSGASAALYSSTITNNSFLDLADSEGSVAHVDSNAVFSCTGCMLSGNGGGSVEPFSATDLSAVVSVDGRPGQMYLVKTEEVATSVPLLSDSVLMNGLEPWFVTTQQVRGGGG